ncbi:hypothetical protein T492DRAFT_982215 [Pavlovales sp. CCMP2436]|nr:hypothetical protein T492DRAFT_982215 [Pavlovales sp. CCMP2436]
MAVFDQSALFALCRCCCRHCCCCRCCCCCLRMVDRSRDAIDDGDESAEGLDQLIEELRNQTVHLQRSTAELQALLNVGRDEDGSVLAEDDAKVYREAVEENTRAIASKLLHLADLQRLRGGHAAPTLGGGIHL